ncbi:hypothetical protein [Arthrobacter sp. ISL-65]|uniref:hypothetical protein n=1 Tax=Arthrobacter sp. ISL-65 TaxID=2819112 RepID=UPI001BE9D1F7|nr:hypothetical protein [Arthrobacter sp. ISL-65]MBT2548315.1 hypothetical protein [Arthrobacter sp. ISL-65]
MANVWGADVEQLRNLSRQLNAGSTEIQRQKNVLSNLLTNTEWMGPDAVQFRGKWESEHVPALARVAQALEEAGQQATRNAQQQSDASQG